MNAPSTGVSTGVSTGGAGAGEGAEALEVSACPPPLEPDEPSERRSAANDAIAALAAPSPPLGEAASGAPPVLSRSVSRRIVAAKGAVCFALGVLLTTQPVTVESRCVNVATSPTVYLRPSRTWSCESEQVSK